MRKIADIGCGINKVDGAVGIDIIDVPGVDFVYDLSKFPWPINDSEYDEVYANHFLEHCWDIISVVTEIHRITKKKEGRVNIRVPHYTSWNYYADLTHRTPFSYRSFDHFTFDDKTDYNYYSPVKFKIESRKILFTAPGAKKNPWKWIGVEYCANRWPHIYERVFAFIIPCAEVQFTLIPISK